MNSTAIFFICALAVLAGMVALQEVGRKLGQRALAKGGEGARAGLAAVEGALYGLMGLLIAFSFSGAAARFDARRQLILQEVNVIRTAWLRLDLLAKPAQSEMRDLFRQLIDSRLAAYRKLPDFDAVRAEIATSKLIEKRIWARAVEASRDPQNPMALHVILALNPMFDYAAMQIAGSLNHPPIIIFLMLVALVLIGSLMAGHAMAANKVRSRVHTIGFAIILAATIYVILDLEFPRLGLINLDDADQVLVQLRQEMN